MNTNKIKFYWAATVAIGLSIFFFVDLACYWSLGPEATLSATIRGVTAVSETSIYVALGGFLMGVWFSHFFQFGSREPE